MRLSDQASNTLTRLVARTAYLSGQLDRDAPFTLMSDSPHVQVNTGGPYWREQVPRVIVDELLENGLIARSSDPTKSANQVFRITERGRNWFVNGLASSSEGV